MFAFGRSSAGVANQMNQSGTPRSRAFAGSATALLAAVVDLALIQANDGLVRASYDSLHNVKRSSPALTNSPVVIVYLDLGEHHDPAKPWPRGLHETSCVAIRDELKAKGWLVETTPPKVSDPKRA